MRARKLARRLAVAVLYEADIRDLPPLDAWHSDPQPGWRIHTLGDDPSSEPSDDEPSQETLDYALELVRGVGERGADIDALIQRYADRWELTRMAIIDRTLIRIATFELLWGRDVPVAVAINEAVELAKDLSTEDSARFVNGILGRVAEDVTDRTTDPPQPR